MTKRQAKLALIARMQSSQQLQELILAELEAGARTMRELMDNLGRGRGELYNALYKLYDANMADTITDRRRDSAGKVIGATWVLAGHPPPARVEHDKKGVPVGQRSFAIPPRDPMMWAVFGVDIEARP